MIISKKNSCDIKKTWDGIKSIIQLSKRNHFKASNISLNGATVTDPFDVATAFNNYFTSVSKTLDSKIPMAKHDFSHYLKAGAKQSMFLTYTTPDEVCSILNLFQTSKACGPNSVPTRILKLARNALSRPLSCIINKSFEQACFPVSLNLARVTPVYKNGCTDLCDNYRPISLLSNISKVFEKAMHDRLYSYLEKFNIIYDKQFGFRKKHSANHALVSLVEKVKSNLDDGKFSCGVFIDLQKAFDTVNHAILLKKLEYYGIRAKVNDWLGSFLASRKQFVTIDDTNSDPLDITHGVPQGSVLGPLLFLIYINDFRHCLSVSEARHFADDTNILLSQLSLKALRKSLSRELRNVFDWLCANRLSLNAKKTELVLFKPRAKKTEIRLTANFGGKRIFLSDRVNYLGVLIDSSLTWTPHITELAKKLNKAIGLLAKMRKFVSASTLRELYFSLFQSYISYGCLVWGFGRKVDRQRLHRIQKRAIRIMTFSDYCEPTSNLFAQMRILKIDDVIEMTRYLFMYDWSKGNLPSSLQRLFTLNTNTTITRSEGRGTLQIPKILSAKFGNGSLRYVGPKLLNEVLHMKIDINLSRSLFKRHICALLLAKY